MGTRKQPRIFGHEIGVHSEILPPFTTPQPPSPGQALVHGPRIGEGHTHTKKRLLGGRFRRVGLFAKIGPSAMRPEPNDPGTSVIGPVGP